MRLPCDAKYFNMLCTLDRVGNKLCTLWERDSFINKKVQWGLYELTALMF